MINDVLEIDSLFYEANANHEGPLRSVKLKIEVTPPTGIVVVYGAPDYAHPVKFTRTQTREIGTTGKTLRYHKAKGITCKITTVGWTESLFANRDEDELRLRERIRKGGSN